MRQKKAMVYEQFAQYEIDILKQMIQERQQRGNYGNKFILHERVMSLVDAKRVRKTAILSEDVSNALDDFSYEYNIDKQYIYDMAIMDFIEKYRK